MRDKAKAIVAAEGRADLGRAMYFHALAQYSIDQSRTPEAWVQLAFQRLLRNEAKAARRDAEEQQGRRILASFLDRKVAQGHDREDIEPFLSALLSAWREAAVLERQDLVEGIETVAQSL